MKILAIRGRNLASLSGDFEVDLAAGPLGDAGVFAISGPTGAGKTTLLDAMCLALFDKTPRLSVVSNRNAAKVGLPDEDEALWTAAHDVKSLLRKGTGVGFAEVDFLGRDAQRYRARWSVWRARERPNGKLQAQEMELRALDALDTRIGRTKEEVLAEIEQRLGLSFEQFRRSALLAQGDFAAFLRADERERAELLEQMTGTSIYGELSVRAFERGKQEAKALEDLEKRHRELVMMTEEERAAVEQRIEAHEQRAQVLQRRLTEAEAAERYHQTLAQLSAQIAEASRALDEAKASEVQAGERRSKLLQVSAALSLAPQLIRRDEAASKHLSAEQERAQSEAHCQHVAQQVTVAQRRRQDAEALLLKLRDGFLQREPDVERATKLDVELSLSAKNVSEAERDTTEAQSKAAKGEATVRALSASLAQVSAELDRAKQEQATSAYLVRLARDWQGVRRALGDYMRQRSAIEQAELPKAEQLALRAEKEQSDAASKLIAAEAKAKQAATALAEAEQEAAQFDTPAIRAQRDQLMSEREVLGEAARTVADVTSAQQEGLLAADAAVQADEQAAALLQSAIASEEECARVEAAIADAEEKLLQARTTQDLAAHRAQLKPEHPCPLCGSHEHPWADGSPAVIAALIEQQQERVLELTRMRRQQEKQSANDRSSHLTFAERAAAERARAAKADVRLAQLEARWIELLAQLGAKSGLPERARAPEAASVVASHQQARAVFIDELKVRERAADAASARQTSARAVFEQARARAEGLRQQAMERKSEAMAAAEALRRARGDVEKARVAQRNIVAEVSEYFFDKPEWDGWKEHLAADVVSFGTSCGQRVVAFNEIAARVEALTKQHDELKHQCDAAIAMASELADLAKTRQDYAKTLRRAYEELRVARAALLGGTPVEAYRQAQRDSLSAGEQRLATSRTEHETQQKALAGAEARLAAASQRCAACESELALAEQGLSAALKTSSLSIETVREAIALGAAWVSRETAALDALRQAVERCRVVLTEREDRRRQHTSGAAPAFAVDAVAAAIVETRASLEEARAASNTERVRLHDDDRERERGAQIATQVQEQRARADRWGGLSLLIGSADGKKFRVFAQSLTFDALIRLANVHLLDLARRYQLMLVPHTDLDLQVIDREMADEVRSVSSLSGGETFLISLALALALSSLGSRDTRVETLFIDEGFGTLDPEALDVALSALDALQDAGRKVGLISHVPGLAERLGAQVRVQPRGAGRSVVLVQG